MNNPSVRELAIRIVHESAWNGVFADELLTTAMREHAQLGGKDRSLLTELVHGTLRWLGQIDWLIQQHFHGNPESLPPDLRSILRVSLYQLRFLDRVPAYAAVNEAVELAKKAGGRRWGNLANAVLRAYLRFPHFDDRKLQQKTAIERMAVHCSHPVWLLERWVRRYGVDETIALCEYNNRRPEITVRTNTLKISTNDLYSRLCDSGFSPTPPQKTGDFIRLDNATGLTESPEFRSGLFTIQDPSTAISCYLLNPQSGETVLDVCSAPGGKTAILAQLMNDSGLLVACDRNLTRLQLLQDNVSRLRLENVQAVIANGRLPAVREVDRVLLDVPCSGFGVLSRRSDLRWKRTANDMREIVPVQTQLLQEAANLLKAGGTLVYSTCTIEPEENESVVASFLAANHRFKLDKEFEIDIGPKRSRDGYWRTLPHIHNMDGIFAARLIKE